MSQPPPPDDQSEALAAAWAAQVTEVRSRIVEVVREYWRALGSYRDADADTFAAAITPVILAGQVQLDHLTRSYIGQLVAQLLADARHVARAAELGPLDYSNLRKATDPADVYRRPFRQVWTDLANGVPFDEAVDRGERRAAKLAETDMQLAKFRGAERTLGTLQSADPNQNMWFERVLTGAENCALCTVASTQRYRVGDLQPIHPACDCNVRPHVGPDPGHVIHPERLEELHNTLNEQLGVSDRGGRAPDYRKIVTTVEHGEYGPTLAIARHGFTGPDDVPA